jgi:hypothetical protein
VAAAAMVVVMATTKRTVNFYCFKGKIKGSGGFF